MTRAEYKGKEMVIVDIMPNDANSFIVVEPGYEAIYKETGVDTKESILKIDFNIAKVYDTDEHVYYIIDNDTGKAVGYYGVHRGDEELLLLPVNNAQ